MSKVTKNVPEKIRLGQFFLKGDVRHKLERVANGSFFARSCQDGQVYAMTRCEIEQDGKYSFKKQTPAGMSTPQNPAVSDVAFDAQSSRCNA